MATTAKRTGSRTIRDRQNEIPRSEAGGRENPAFLSLAAQLRDLCGAAASSCVAAQRARISFIAADECVVRTRCAAPIALIVSEALSNAFKHAHPSGVAGKIDVDCRQDAKGRIVIEVTDDGVGFPENFDPAIDGGYGMHLIRKQTEQLHATLDFESTCLGLRVCLTLPDQMGVDNNAAAGAHTHERIESGPAGQLIEDLIKGRTADGVLGEGGRWRQAFQALPAAIYTTDAAGRITFFNEAAAELWGCRPELGKDEFCGSWKLYRPDGAPLPHDQCPMAMTLKLKRQIRGVEAVAERPDGTRVPFIPYPTPLFGECGILLGAINMLVDISDRKHAEEALKRHRDEQSALYQFTDKLFRAGSLGDACDAALAAIDQALGCKRASILLLDAAGAMRFVAWSGLSDAYRQAVDGHSPWSRKTKDAEPICVPDVECAEFPGSLKDSIRAEGIGALAFIPLVANGELIGKFMTYYGSRHAFSDTEINLSLTIARQLGFSIERTRSEEIRTRAERTNQLLVSIIETSDDAIVSKNLDGIVTSWNRGAERLFGYAAGEMVGKSILTLIPSQRHGEERDIIDRIRRGEHVEHYDTIRQHKDGSLIEISLTVSPVKDAAGKVVGASKIARDIGERKRLEKQRELLINEVKHRVKNTLATVQALAGQTMPSASRSDLDAFLGRLHTLGNAYDLLTSESWDRASVQKVVARALEPFHTPRFVVHGPDEYLSAEKSLRLTMVLHELATNAVKYGALSTADGKISVLWKHAGSERLRLTWRETGGPPVEPPQRKGFGSMLIEHSLDGAEFAFEPNGITCALDISL